jgi:hypothetical protein|tara:strand:- start:1531 stop:1812 length:282 start_codon:yes stop_codon:yes gene_type:complete
MTTPVQNFDLFDIEAGDDLSRCVDVPGSAANLPMSSEQLTTIINQILDDNGEPIEAMDFTRADHREYFAGTVAHAMLDRMDIHITTPNNNEDK